MAEGKKRVVVSDSEDDVNGADFQAESSARKAPSSSPTKRPRLSVPAPDVELDDDDLAELSDAPDTQPESSRAGAMRAANRNDPANDDEESGGEEEGGEGDEEGEGQGGVAGEVRYRPELERGADGYVAGSVTRIKMIDFMTYDHVEFHPGPHLNMILGPNGTGKSTIAAGIAIGLGFPPRVMGRATELRAYVKQGLDHAITEIELKGRAGKKNPVIWRKFNREDKSEWKLNGAPSTGKAVRELVLSFGVQANNLCSFLPQDKVAEFAKMSDITTMKETMRAAGDPRLSKWHESLVVKGQERKTLEEALTQDTARRDVIQGQVNNLAPDVRNFEQREEMELEKEVLKMMVVAIQAEDQKKLYAQAREERKECKTKILKWEDKSAPLKKLQERWSTRTARAGEAVKHIEDEVKEHGREMKRHIANMNTKIGEAEQYDNELAALKNKMQRQKARREAHEKAIRDAQAILDEPQDEVQRNYDKHKKMKVDHIAKMNEAKADLDRLREELQHSEKQLQDIGRGIDERMKTRQGLSNVETQKENNARATNGSINYVLDWLDKHGAELESPVHRPPMISVNVRERAYAWQVEACLNQGQRSTFICESRKDYDRLAELNGTLFPAYKIGNQEFREGRVRLNLHFLEVTEELINPRRPCSADELRRLGFDGMAIDYVDAEPAVIAFLNSTAALHRCALSQASGNDFDNNRIANHGFRLWCSRNTVTTAKQSRYGSRHHLLSTQPSQPARFFNLSVNHEAVAQVGQEIQDLKRKQGDMEKPHAEVKAKMESAKKRRESLADDSNEIDRALDEIKRSRTRYQKAAVVKTNEEEKLKRLLAEPSSDQERARLKAERLRKTLSALRPMQDLQEKYAGLVNLTDKTISGAFAHMGSLSNAKIIQNRVRQGEAESQRLEQEHARLSDKVNEVLARSNRLTLELRELRDQTSVVVIKRVAERMRESESLVLDDVRNELETIKADLEISIGINPNVVIKFKKLSADLESVSAVVEAGEKKLAKLRQDINSILSRFDPALDNLVTVVSDRFRAAFDRLGCSGEVVIHRDERGFEHWGMKVMTSFRNTDKLQALSGFLQSGGERSLATVTYLMSLSEMARTPFSLVDEINQGMDQTAERNVHNQLVEVTCNSNTGQYFLITPKLLDGLTYHKKMKILLVQNGPSLPDATDKTRRFGGLKACLARYKASGGGITA